MVILFKIIHSTNTKSLLITKSLYKPLCITEALYKFVHSTVNIVASVYRLPQEVPPSVSNVLIHFITCLFKYLNFNPSHLYNLISLNDMNFSSY